MATLRTEFMSLPMSADGFAETHRSHVSMWELDENDHWHAQFYLRAFQQASEILAVAATGQNPGAASISVRHVRFFRELRGGDPLTVLSARILDGPNSGQIAHLMRHTQDGRLCASALDVPGFDVSSLPAFPQIKVAEVAPQGISLGAHSPADTTPLLESGQAIVSHLSVVRPFELDHTGALQANTLHARLAEAMSHLWEQIEPLSSQLYSTGLGRALVEIKIVRHGMLRAGDALRIVSWFDNMGDRSFLMRHQLENILTTEAIASISTVVLILDPETRRSAPVPSFLRDAYLSYSGKFYRQSKLTLTGRSSVQPNATRRTGQPHR